MSTTKELKKPLTTKQLHNEQIKEALRGASDETKQEMQEKRKQHIREYLKTLHSIKPIKKPFNQTVNVPLVPKMEDLEKIDEERDFDQVMKDYIESECIFGEDENSAFFVDDEDPDYKRAITGEEDVEINPDYEYDQEPIEEEVYSAKVLSKDQALKAFTGKTKFAKQFKFITSGYSKVAIGMFTF